MTSEPDDDRELQEAAQSSLGFWDNAFDDADWNVVPPSGDEGRQPADPSIENPESDEAVEWNAFLQERLHEVDRGEIDPRPWSEILEEMRELLREKHKS